MIIKVLVKLSRNLIINGTVISIISCNVICKKLGSTHRCMFSCAELFFENNGAKLIAFIHVYIHDVRAWMKNESIAIADAAL